MEDTTVIEDNMEKKPEEILESTTIMPEGYGGRRHRGSKKMHKGKRHGNASLRAWVTFVKKVQREEKLSYKEAMMRAKQRKDKGEKWHGGERWRGGDEEEDKEVFVDGVLMGGRRHRRTHKRSRSHSRSRAHKRSRSHRRSRRHH